MCALGSPPLAHHRPGESEVQTQAGVFYRNVGIKATGYKEGLPLKDYCEFLVCELSCERAECC